MLIASKISAKDLFTITDLTNTGEVSLVSDYKSHGITQSSNNPAGQGFIRFQYKSGVYSKLWASSIANSSATLEMNTDLGYSTNIGNYVVDVGYRKYVYAGSGLKETGTNELYSFLGFASMLKDSDSIKLGISYNSNVSRANIAYNTPINDLFDLILFVEYSKPETEKQWLNYKLGTTFSINGIQTELAYVGTDINSHVDDVNGSFLLKLTKKF